MKLVSWENEMFKINAESKEIHNIDKKRQLFKYQIRTAIHKSVFFFFY